MSQTTQIKPDIPSRKAVSRFIERHYRHFNAGCVMDAAKAYSAQIDGATL
jgi:hypothetical protein